MGYTFAVIIQAVTSFFTLHCVVTIVTFLIGTVWIFISFTKDISNDLLLLNADNKPSGRNADTKKKFIDIIQYYADIKQLSAEKNVISKLMSLTKNIHYLSVLLLNSMQYINTLCWGSFRGLC